MRLLKKLLLASFVAALVLVSHAAPAKAYSNENMIDNAVFDNKDAMNEAQIRSFIQSRPNTCLTRTGAGLGGGNVFDEPTDYFTYGPNKVDAARVIYQAAQYNEINPRVILATLQKEQSMLTDNDCVDPQGYGSLNKAMGYACYEGASACPAAWAAGFERQVMKGAWQLAFDRHRAEGETSWGGNDSINYGGRMTEGNRKRCGTCALIYYDGYSVIDGVNTRMGNGATASLYNYTPHRNQSFPIYFEQFFGAGSTSAVPYAWQYVSQGSSAGSVMQPGQKATWTLTVKNIGAATWSNSGANPIRLGSWRPMDRTSVFCTDTWRNCARPATLNESSVAPGQNGTFTFEAQAPAAAGAYFEYFNLLAEGATWMNDVGLYYGVTVAQSDFSYTVISNTTPASMSVGSTTSVTLTLLNTSSSTWLRGGNSPIRLGTSSPLGRTSPFYSSSWYTINRPSQLNESSVAPGQNGTFTYVLTAPTVTGQYTESFTPVAEGYKWFSQAVVNSISVTAQSVSTYMLGSGQDLLTGQSLASQDGRYRLVMQTDGNLVLYSPGRAIWSTGTAGRPATRLAVQTDGNVVLYDASYKYYWASWTQNKGSVRLVVQTDGNLVLYDSQNRAVWNSRTAGQV